MDLRRCVRKFDRRSFEFRVGFPSRDPPPVAPGPLVDCRDILSFIFTVPNNNSSRAVRL